MDRMLYKMSDAPTNLGFRKHQISLQVCPNYAVRFDLTSFLAFCRTKCHFRWSFKHVANTPLAQYLHQNHCPHLSHTSMFHKMSLCCMLSIQDYNVCSVCCRCIILYRWSQLTVKNAMVSPSVCHWVHVIWNRLENWERESYKHSLFILVLNKEYFDQMEFRILLNLL